jgi:hypothetical protein
MSEDKKEVKAEEVKELTGEEKTAKLQAFVDAYGELVKEHGIDFATYPAFIPDGAGGFKITVQNTPVDISNQPKKSPFVAE